LEICFSHKKSREWAISWTHKLMEKFQNVDGMILYNPRILLDCCYCKHCVIKFLWETGTLGFPRLFKEGTLKYEKWMDWRAEELTEFIDEWNCEINKNYPQLQTGAVLNPPQYLPQNYGQDLSKLGEILDIIFPFVQLHEVTDDNYAGRICNDTQNIVFSKTIADIKIYGPYNNTDSGIVNAIKSSMNSDGDGFFVWSYDYLNSSVYDIQKIINAYNGIYC